MSDLLVLRAVLFVGECLAVSLLLPVSAFAATALMRRAALRHLVWTTLFGVLAVLPFAALLLPPRLIVSHVAAPLPVPVLVDVPAIALPVAAAPPPTLSPGDLLLPGNIVILLATLWLAGLAWQLLRLGLGGFGLMRLRRASAPFASETATGCAVRLSRDEAGPSTFGILRPVILLPRSAQDWCGPRLDAVLRHEAAHVARRDAASQLIARLVCALYWFNPLLWLAARSQRRDAEIAADDAVLASGLTPSLYAAELVRLAAEANGIAPGIAMARPPLAQRVEAVLSENSSRKGVSRMDIAKTVSFGLAATLLLGAARFDLAVAQDVAPKVERNVEKDVAIEARAKAQTAEFKAKADKAVAQARAKAAAETDPVKKEQYRKEAETMAVEATRVKADADSMVAARLRAADAGRATADVQRAIEAKAAAVKAQADVNVANARARAAAERDPAQKDLFRRIAEEKAAEAAVTKANADLTVAQARDVWRQREEETRRRIATQGVTVQQAEQMLAQARERASADMQRVRDAEIAERDLNKDDNVAISVNIRGNSASGNILGNSQVRQTLDDAIKMAVMEARSKINAAIARANAAVGVSPDKAGADSHLDLGVQYVPDRIAPVPPAPLAPPPPPALKIPPVPPVPPPFK